MTPESRADQAGGPSGSPTPRRAPEGEPVTQFDFSRQPPWGPGGLELTISPDDQPRLRDLLRGVGRITKPSADRFCSYACGLGAFAAEGGPSDATAVGRALGLREGAVHDIFDPDRSKWNSKVIRHQLSVAALSNRLDAIVLGRHFTQYGRPGALIVTAHAFSGRGRVLVAAARATLGGPDEHKQELAAYQRVVEEAGLLLSPVGPPTPIPILAESASVGEIVIEALALLGVDYLVELPGSWAAGGILPLDDVAEEGRKFGGGMPIRGLFGRAAEALIRSRPVGLMAWGHGVAGWAALASTGSSERTYLGNVRDGSKLDFARARNTVEKRAEHWAGQGLDGGAADNYGLDRYHAPDETAFQRHCTALTLRDAYALKQPGDASGDEPGTLRSE